MSDEPSESRQWTAWRRRRPWLSWEPRAHGETEQEALRASLALKLSGDWCVLPAGTDPNRKERAR